MTYKRPLKEGEICEDQRNAFNPYLGQGKAEEVSPLAASVAEVSVAKASKKEKPKAEEVPTEEILDEVLDDVIEDVPAEDAE